MTGNLNFATCVVRGGLVTLRCLRLFAVPQVSLGCRAAAVCEQAAIASKGRTHQDYGSLLGSEKTYQAFTMSSVEQGRYLDHMVATRVGRGLLVACRETADPFRSVLFFFPVHLLFYLVRSSGHGPCSAAKGLTSTLQFFFALDTFLPFAFGGLSP